MLLMGNASFDIRRLLRDQNGSTMPIFVLCLAALVGLVGFALAFAFDLRTTSRLQQDADTAALAGASAYIMENFSTRETSRLQSAEQAARISADAVAWDTTQAAAVQVQKVGTFRQKATVEVNLSSRPENRFASWVGASTDRVRSRTAKAEVTRGLPLCVLTLGLVVQGVEIDGGGTLNAEDCVVWSNAGGLLSMSFSGSGSATAELFCAVGRTYKASNFTATPRPSENCDSLPDPLESWEAPKPGLCTSKSPSRVRGHDGETVTLQPATYCNGLTISADNVILEPGVYFIKNGALTISSDSQVIGEGVTIVLTGSGATMEMKGQSLVDISSPTSGPLAGLVLVSDRTTDIGSDVKLVGGAGFSIKGLIYLPRQDLEIGGGGTLNTTAPNLQIIARSMRYSGNGTLNLSYDKNEAALGSRVITNSFVRLVE